MKTTAMFVLATALVAGCGGKSGPGSPLGVAGAILTAPITAPIMFFERDATTAGVRVTEARRIGAEPLASAPNRRAFSGTGRGGTSDRARGGAVNETVHWQNRHDASGHVVGGATVLAKGLYRIVPR